MQLQIVGILGRKAPPDIMVFHRDYLQEALEATSGRTPFTDSMWVMPDSDAAASQVAKQIDEYFANWSSATQTETENAFFSDFLSNYRLIFGMAKWLGLIVVVTIGLVAANTASMSIRERRGEIALMRSLGFPSYRVLWMLLAESAAIATLGEIIGCSGALLLVNGARLGGLGPLSMIRMPPLVLAEAMVIAVGIGFLSAWVPRDQPPGGISSIRFGQSESRRLRGLIIVPHNANVDDLCSRNKQPKSSPSHVIAVDSERNSARYEVIIRCVETVTMCKIDRWTTAVQRFLQVLGNYPMRSAARSAPSGAAAIFTAASCAAAASDASRKVESSAAAISASLFASPVNQRPRPRSCTRPRCRTDRRRMA